MTIETPERSPSAERIAVYWDFENIHNGVQLRNAPAPSRVGFREPERLANVKVIMDYLNSLGNVVINRAYANWTMLRQYRFVLMEHSVDLVQLFPRGSHAKNGADIRLAIDAVEDVFHYPYVTMQVVIGGDSDFSNLAQKLRTRGRYVIGIGAKNSSNIYWIKACNEFKYYHTLLEGSGATVDEETPAESEEAPTPANRDDAKDLLLRAVRRLARSRDDGRVSIYTVRPMMVRLDPSFDEGNYGYKTFTQFVEECHDVVEIQKDEDGGPFVAPVTVESSVTASDQDASSVDLESVYRNALRQINYRLEAHAERIRAFETLYELLQTKAPIEDTEAVKELLLERYTDAGNPISPEQAQNIWDMGFKANLYYFQEYPYRSIVLNERVPNLAAVMRRADLSVIKRLVSKSPVQPLDPDAVAKMLYGPEHEKLDYVRELIGEAVAMS